MHKGWAHEVQLQLQLEKVDSTGCAPVGGGHDCLCLRSRERASARSLAVRDLSLAEGRCPVRPAQEPGWPAAAAASAGRAPGSCGQRCLVGHPGTLHRRVARARRSRQPQISGKRSCPHSPAPAARTGPPTPAARLGLNDVLHPACTRQAAAPAQAAARAGMQRLHPLALAPWPRTAACPGSLRRQYRDRLPTFCVAGTRKVGTLTSEPALCSTWAAAWKSSVLPPVQDLRQPAAVARPGRQLPLMGSGASIQPAAAGLPTHAGADCYVLLGRAGLPQGMQRPGQSTRAHPIYTRSMGVPEHSAAVLRLSGECGAATRGCRRDTSILYSSR